MLIARAASVFKFAGACLQRQYGGECTPCSLPGIAANACMYLAKRAIGIVAGEYAMT